MWQFKFGVVSPVINKCSSYSITPVKGPVTHSRHLWRYKTCRWPRVVKLRFWSNYLYGCIWPYSMRLLFQHSYRFVCVYVIVSYAQDSEYTGENLKTVKSSCRHFLTMRDMPTCVRLHTIYSDFPSTFSRHVVSPNVVEKLTVWQAF